jgi:hypothetical protein
VLKYDIKMKNLYATIILLLLLCSSGALAASEAIGTANTAGHAMAARCGIAVPLSELGDRAAVYLPAFSLSYRYTAGFGDLPPVCLELEAGFFAYRAERKIAGDRATVYTEMLMLHVIPAIRLRGELRLFPSFGTGMIFNIVRQSSSPGIYTHAAFAAGIELGYRVTERFSVHLGVRALFGLDRDRIFYHLVPEAGVVYQI